MQNFAFRAIQTGVFRGRRSESLRRVGARFFVCPDQSIMATHPTTFREGNPEHRMRAAELLEKYPELSVRELHELVVFYNTSPAIDTALLTCEPRLMPKIALFHAEQKSSLHHETSLHLIWGLVGICMIAIGYAVWAGM
ncbi:hypothetical protein FGU71_01820 [Erythrobacter insulae]|uniref:Uncharacterized protein n=1 Tax=Erythrobacter insulae TaxID=2584124 RepID=A0A547P9C5_9SPHN|nr:hypothetical protein [Erythrobacter insulae]TRD10726.1 hypothetical protein FGU71_01820 [Erythrobacter insulae]